MQLKKSIFNFLVKTLFLAMAAAIKPETLCMEMCKVAVRGFDAIDDRFTAVYNWIDEYITDAKQTLKA